MVYLPETMPASFQAIYTPVESAGTEAQIKHLARLMATQMTAAGLGPGESRADPGQALALDSPPGKAVGVKVICHPSWVHPYAECSVSQALGFEIQQTSP